MNFESERQCGSNQHLDAYFMDFEFLVKSNVDSAKMSALQSSGLALIRLQAYRNSMFNIIVDTIFGLALKALK